MEQQKIHPIEKKTTNFYRDKNQEMKWFDKKMSSTKFHVLEIYFTYQKTVHWTSEKGGKSNRKLDIGLMRTLIKKVG
jgi:hypothetical protein